MPQPTNYDSIISALTNSVTSKESNYWFYKNTLTADAQGSPTFYWRATGIPVVGAVPATGVGTLPTKDTVGAMFLRNATAPDNSYLTTFDMYIDGTVGDYNSFMLVDVLWFNSGLSGTVITAQTINSSALTRYTGTNSAGNYLGLVCWTATGSTASNVTCSYTNQAGTAGKTTPSVVFWTGAFGAGAIAPTADQVQILPLALGDTGIRSIESLTLSASTLTAGNFGAMIFRPLATLTQLVTTGMTRDLVLQIPSLPQKINDACLSIITVQSTTSLSKYIGSIKVIEA